MRKTPSLFVRDWNGDRSLVTPEINPAAQWVIDGEGIATKKFDGTCCLVKAGKLYKRYDAKKGKTPPLNFIPAQDPDPITGHRTGWIPVGMEPESKWHRKAWEDADFDRIRPADGTYELIGPKIGGNPENVQHHYFVRHGDVQYPGCPRDFYGIKDFLEFKGIEGIVWHRNLGDPNTEMVKIKTSDFGLRR